jgi:hypothetical protein
MFAIPTIKVRRQLRASIAGFIVTSAPPFTRHRVTSPDGPMPRNFASEQKLWQVRTGSREDIMDSEADLDF